MKTLSFAFFVTLYFVFTHINCDIKSSHLHQDKITLRKILNNKTNEFGPISINHSYESEFERIDLDDALLSNEQRGKICLKNITNCMEKDGEYEETTNHLGNLLFSSLPPFDLSHTNGVSLDCQKQSRKYLQDLKKFKLWALQMYDSTAKLPSGILNGNVNQLGDFDRCMDVYLDSHNIRGQYCLASMQVQSPHSSYLAGLHRLMQSHFHFRSKFEDPGHRVPRFSSINWALCVPSACTNRDVKLGLRKVVQNIVNNTELEVRIEVEADMCQSSVPKPIPTSTYIATSLFELFGVMILWATLYDYTTTEEKNEWIMAFSLKKNVTKLIETDRSSNDIETVHGIRCLNAILLVFAHKAMAIFFIPYTNRTEFVEYLARPFSVIGRAASLYTDPFIMFSGTLTAYSLLGKLDKRKTINVFEEYSSRLLRIVPPFAALITFCTFVLPWINTGPMWNLVITHHSDICKQYWWRNIMFIHNYFGFQDMCLTHTHHVGIDTQLFFISPVLIYILWKWPKKGAIALVTIALISTIMRYYVTYTLRLNNYIHYGTSIQQLFDTADNMYILPAHRITVYIMGIFLAYVLRHFSNVTLTQTQMRVGNTVALFCFLVSFFGPSFMGSIDYVYNPRDAAWYAAFAPILWCTSFAWIIFTYHTGYRGYLGQFFALPIFTIWTRLSYAVYLTQFPMYFYNVGTTRTAENFGFFSKIFSLKEYGWILVISVGLTLGFELPFQNIRNIIFKKETRKETDNVQKKVL